MSTQHTQEPWKVSEYRPKNVLDSDGYGIVAEIQVARREDGEQEENARRIVACVNACAGITTDDLVIMAETGGIAKLTEDWSLELHAAVDNAEDFAGQIQSLEQQRDALQAKCDELVASAKSFRDCVLHQRWNLEGNGMTSYQINDVLNLFDDTMGDAITKAQAGGA